MEMRVKYVPGRHVEPIGFDMGRRNRQMEVLAERKREDGSVVVACRKYGAKYWSGIGQARGYAPARTVVYQLTRKSKEADWRADELLEIPRRTVRERSDPE